MSSQYSQALEGISSALEACEAWTATEVMLQVATSLTDDTPVPIDLTETLISKGKHCQSNQCNVYWLPKEFLVNTKEFRTTTLLPYFARACQAAGFNVLSKGYDKDRYYCRIVCQRGLFARNSRGSGTDEGIQTHRSQRPFAGEHKKCPFDFKVYWSNRSQRWYLPMCGNGDPKHDGHLRRAPETVRVLMKNTPIDERQIAQDILSQFGACTTTIAVLRKRTGLSVSKDQMKHLQRKLRDATQTAQLSAIAEVPEAIQNNLVVTPADKLLSKLDSDPLASYVALYGVQNSNLVREIEEGVETWEKCSADMVDSVRSLLLSPDGEMQACSRCVDSTLKEMAKLLQTLRSAKLNPPDDESYHALSPEAHDPWERISMLVRSIRAIDGDHEDVNYLIRAREVERHLEQAIDNEPKLEQAEAKVSSLEKVLSSRSKEIALQNARLSELERVVAKSGGPMGRVVSSEMKSVEEYNSLREENRVLTEAMDVLQRQVDEYENEIRVLKDFKTPKRGGAARGTPRRAMTTVGDFGSAQRSTLVEDKQTSTGALEATIFRPALQQALEESARWKTTAVASLLDLPPLPMPTPEESKMSDERADDLHQLNTALADYRFELASIKLVDLTRKDKSPREQLRENKSRSAAVTMKLESVLRQCRGKIM